MRKVCGLDMVAICLVHSCCCPGNDTRTWLQFEVLEWYFDDRGMGEGVYRGLCCNSVARGLGDNSGCEGKSAVEFRKDAPVIGATIVRL